MNKALIIVDVQYDFLPGGSLAVEGGDEIIPVINQLVKDYDLIIFTRDFHPSNHKSFASQHEGKNVFDQIKLNGIDQVLWPDHCVQGTRGSDIHDDLIGNPDLKNKKVYIFKKGMDPEYDSYSGFKDANDESTGLYTFLLNNMINSIDICGLATDFCCKFTSLDSSKYFFETRLLLSSCRSISKNIEKDINELKINNIKITQ